MSKKHKKNRHHKKHRNKKMSSNAHDRVMNKLGKVREKTGKLVDWNEVDKATMGNQFSFLELLKKVWNIAIGRKNENKA